MDISPEKQNDDLENEPVQEPILYERYDENELVTHNIYFDVRDQEKKLNRDLVIEFRERLESFLFSKRAVNVKFHPLKWRYFRDYFRKEQGMDWRKAKNNTVLYPDFFLQDSRFSGEISFESLTDDEKIQIVVPKFLPSGSPFAKIFGKSDEEILEMEKLEQEKINSGEHFDNLTPERRQAILEKLNESLYKVNIKDNDNPYQWHRWGYDIYSFDTPCRISFTEDRKDFEFFFAWKLALTDLYDTKLFLDWHLRNTFEEDIDIFKGFVRLLLMKYHSVIDNEFISKITNEFLDELKKKDVEDLESNKKIIIPIKVIRKKGDTITSLTSEQTAIVYQLQRQAGIILRDDKLLSNESLAKALKVLTGYGVDNMSDNLGQITFNKIDLEITKAALENLIILIDNKLKK